MSVAVLPVEKVQTEARRLASSVVAIPSPFTGGLEVQDWGGRWWEYDLRFADMVEADGRKLSAFFAALGGPAMPFLYRDPALKRDASGLGSPIVDGAGQSGSILWTGGWTPAGVRNKLRNSSMESAEVGALDAAGSLPATWGRQNLLTDEIEVVSVGIEDDLPTIRVRFNGTPSGASVNLFMCSNVCTPAAVGQTWAATVWSQLVGGSLTNVSSIRMRIYSNDGAGVFLSNVAAGGEWTDLATRARRGGAVTLGNASTAHVQAVIAIGTTGPIDLTLKIQAPQLEQAPAATAFEATPQIVMRAGDGFSLGSGADTRMHMVVADVQPDPFGDAFLPIVPPLRASPANAAPLEVENPAVFLRLNETVPVSVRPAHIYTVSVTAREAL